VMVRIHIPEPHTYLMHDDFRHIDVFIVNYLLICHPIFDPVTTLSAMVTSPLHLPSMSQLFRRFVLVRTESFIEILKIFWTLPLFDTSSVT